MHAEATTVVTVLSHFENLASALSSDLIELVDLVLVVTSAKTLRHDVDEWRLFLNEHTVRLIQDIEVKFALFVHLSTSILRINTTSAL